MGRQAYIYSMVLEYLEANPGLHGTTDIVKGTGASYPSIARTVKQLAKEKRVKKRRGPGNSYLYEFVSHEIKSKDKLPVGQSISVVDPIKAENLKELIDNWLSNGWNPKSLEAPQTLVNTLSQLYQFQWLEVTKGLSVDQSDLDHCKTKVIQAKAQIDSISGFFASLLATDELWDNKKITSYTLKDVEEDPQEYLERARTVNEVLR